MLIKLLKTNDKVNMLKAARKMKTHYFQGNKDKNVHWLYIRNNVNQKVQSNLERKKMYFLKKFTCNKQNI